jgi:predicted NBD/HSP70 family sugar kinase
VIGVDLGGTKVLAAISDLDGTILAERSASTDGAGREVLVEQLRGLAHGLAEDAEVPWKAVRSLSIGVPGTVDPGTGQVMLAPNIAGLNGISLGDELGSEERGPELLIENDVNFAALGERWQGWAKEAEHFAFIAIGTGIAAGLVGDGRLYRGFRGAAGEIGFLPFGGDPFDPAVRLRGALEGAVAGPGIVAEVERRLAAGEASELRAGCTAAEVFAAAGRGDCLAGAAVDREARLVAMAIASVASVVAPEIVILGGGIGADRELLEPVRRYAGELTPKPLRIERSALGPRAALIGALARGLEAAGGELGGAGSVASERSGEVGGRVP